MADNYGYPFGDPADLLGKDTSSTRKVDTTRVDAAALGDYNPFESNVQLTGEIQAHTEYPSSYSALEAQLSATAELERRRQELDARAAELARREEEQNRLAEQARNSSTNKNWPPLPSFCPCKPCFYIDIRSEIAPEHQSFVFFGYYLWLAYVILLCLNIFGALIAFVGTDISDAGSRFGISIVIGAFCIPASFLCWFRPIYKAFKNNSSINFFIFFIVFAAQTAVMGIQALGFSGSCGWLAGLAVVKQNSSIGGFILFLASLFSVLTVLSGLYLIHVHRVYRGTGASFLKARQELTRDVLSDTAVRAAASGAGIFSSV